jgi:hypothetical protein
VALRPCRECNKEISSDAKVCPHCGKKLGMGKSGGCLVLVLVVFVLVLLIGALINTDNSQNPGVSPPHTASAVNDAELLIARCGHPTSDDSTATDNPRPPIPTRIIEYKKQKLRFLFIPGGTSGDPPPYNWRLVGSTDMTAADPSKARVVSPSELARRMPCWTVDAKIAK